MPTKGWELAALGLVQRMPHTPAHGSRRAWHGMRGTPLPAAVTTCCHIVTGPSLLTRLVQHGCRHRHQPLSVRKLRDGAGLPQAHAAGLEVQVRIKHAQHWWGSDPAPWPCSMSHAACVRQQPCAGD
jgi:hypothetical protein